MVVFDPTMLARSANRARFYLECLAELDQSLARRGGTLIVRTGDVVAETMRVARSSTIWPTSTRPLRNPPSQYER